MSGSARPWNLSGSGRNDLVRRRIVSQRTVSSPLRVLKSTPSAAMMSPRSQCLNSACRSAPMPSSFIHSWMRPWGPVPEPSCRVAKLALPCTRFSTMRPATETRGSSASRSSRVLWSCSAIRLAARCAGRASFGKAIPFSRRRASLARRSLTTWFSSNAAAGGAPVLSSLTGSDSRLQAGDDEGIEIAVEHRLGVGDLHVGAQVLDARIVEDVGADLVAPPDVGLASLDLVLLGPLLAHLELIEPSPQHVHRLVLVPVLRPVVLALHDHSRGQVGDAHRGLGPVHVLAARAGGAIDVDAQVGWIDLDLDRVVDFGIDEHGGKRGVPAPARVEGRLANQAMDPGLRAQVAVRVVARDANRRTLDAGDLALGFLEDLRRESLALAVAQVLPEQHRRPVLRLGAPRARLDLQEAGPRVGRVGEHAAELQRFHHLLDGVGVAVHGEEGFLVALVARDVEQLARIPQVGFDLVDDEDDVVERFLLAAERLRVGRILPDVRVLEQAIDFFETILLQI